MTMVGSALRAGAAPRIFASIAQKKSLIQFAYMCEHMINIACSGSVKREQRAGLFKQKLC